MKNKVIILIIVGLIAFMLYGGYPKLHIKSYDEGDSAYDKYMCFVYKIEPKDGEGVNGVPQRLVAYIYTNAPPDRTNVQFEWRDDNGKYLSARLWLDEPNSLGGGTVEKLGQYEYKVSYPIASGHHYDNSIYYGWNIIVWLSDSPHVSGGVSIWYIDGKYWHWYKDDRQAPDYTPTADAGGPYITQVGKKIKLDASKSTTPSGSDIIDWYWDINNDGIWNKYGKTTYVSFQNTGVYIIKLLVVNDKAFYDDGTTTIIVTNVNNPPVADTGYGDRIKVNAGDTVVFDGSKSYDPDGTIVKYEWDLDGDGKYEQEGCTKSIRYIHFMSYNVKLRVTDDDGAQDVDSVIVDVSEVLYHLNVLASPPEGGIVELNPSGGIYEPGTAVVLRAVPNAGWIFDHWEGIETPLQYINTASNNPVTIVMNSNRTVTAYFVRENPTKYTLTVKSEPSGGGVISLNPTGGQYDYGTVVTLTATPNNGYVFDHWSGDGSGKNTSITVTITKDTEITAHFTKTGGSMIPLGLLLLVVVAISAIGVLLIRRKSLR